jgi:hypothetical protein
MSNGVTTTYKSKRETKKKPHSKLASDNTNYYKPMVINFGLRNAPATFQRLMNKILQPVKAKYREDVQGYIDDILIATKDDSTYHQEVVRTVLSVL